MNEEEVKKAICGNCKMAGMGVCGACQIDFETATQQICQLSPKTADYPDGDEPKPEPDKTKLHEWGKPKGLPRGWRGRVLKGNTESKPSACLACEYEYKDDGCVQIICPHQIEPKLEDFFAEHHCELDAIMMDVLSKVAAMIDKNKLKPSEGGLLTEQGITDAQVAYLKAEGEALNAWGNFPLRGERRDDCIKKAQRDLTASDKDAELMKKCDSCLFRKSESQLVQDYNAIYMQLVEKRVGLRKYYQKKLKEKDAEWAKEIDKAEMRGEQKIIDNMETPAFQTNMMKALRPAIDAECQARIGKIKKSVERYLGYDLVGPEDLQDCWKELWKEGVK